MINMTGGQPEVGCVGVAADCVALPTAEASSFDPSYPASDIGDLLLVRAALSEHETSLSRRYSPQVLAHTDEIVSQQLGAMMDRWVDPQRNADMVLAELLAALQSDRDAQREVIKREYGDNTMPPDVFAPLAPQDAKIRDVQEIIADRAASPSPCLPRTSSYSLGPVRRAIILQATQASDPATRLAALDLAERRFPPFAARLSSAPRLFLALGGGMVRRAVFFAR